MIVYRICKAKYAKTAFSGTGGLDSPGRWHRKGQPIIYTASTLSLAALELLIHLGRTDSRIALVSVHATIPDDLAKDGVDAKGLPANWNSSPPIDATMDLGTKWCASKRSVVMRVPSAVIQGEFNYLLNPLHADFKLIRASMPEPFTFDQRLWK